MRTCARCQRKLPDDYRVCPFDANPLDANEEPLAQPLFAGRYEILRKLGEGGTAGVYKALDVRSGKPVAVKVIEGPQAKTATWAERLLREVELLQTIRHPNVVSVLGGGRRDDGSPYLVMEYLEGETLGQLMRRTPLLSIEAALAIATEVAAGLAATHAYGVIHRDVKPDNIFLIEEAGEVRRAKVFDFGFARLQGAEGLTAKGFIVGTPEYMAPEQTLHDPTGHRTDIYGLGVVLYRMITGALPFNGDAATLLAQHLYLTPRPPSELRVGVTHDIDVIVMGTLRKLPRNRYPSMQDLFEDLERAMGKRPGKIAASMEWDDVYEPQTPFARAIAEKLKKRIERD
ncbi:MAG TPA: serine/threonine-protein kinase [Polyangiaceae bacterium]|jgi:serine/threonine-protein kinase